MNSGKKPTQPVSIWPTKSDSSLFSDKTDLPEVPLIDTLQKTLAELSPLTFFLKPGLTEEKAKQKLAACLQEFIENNCVNHSGQSIDIKRPRSGTVPWQRK